MKDYAVYSVDGADMLVDPSSFDADVLFADSIDVFEPISPEEEQVFNIPNREERKTNESNPVIGKQSLSKCWEQTDSVLVDRSIKETPKVNVSLHLEPTDQIRKAKRRMESAFIDDYVGKIKPFKRDIREDYKGEYTFTVHVGVIDNTIEA